MFGIGTQELMILGIIGLLLFGKRLPEVARSLGKGVVEFKKGIQGIEDTVDHRSAYSSSSASRPVPRDEREELAAPKFEPPASAPTEEVKA